MTARAVTWIDGIAVPGQDMRLLTAALGVPDAALSARSGVRPGTDLLVTALGTPNMSVNVAAGQAFIDGTESFAQGLFLASNDGTVNLTIAAADATNPRSDLIVARVYGETVTPASRRFALEVMTGSPAASPVDPATPANSLILGRVLVAAGASSISSGAITDRRVFTTALGGVIPCLSTARPSSPYSGMSIFETDTLRSRVWDAGSSTWLMDSPRTTTARTTAPAGGTTSGTTELTVASLTLPSVPYATTVQVSAAALPQTFSVATDIFDVRLYIGGTLFRTGRASNSDQSVPVADVASIAASTATTVELRVVRVSGTGTVPISSNSTYTYISALISPA